MPSKIRSVKLVRPIVNVVLNNEKTKYDIKAKSRPITKPFNNPLLEPLSAIITPSNRLTPFMT